MKSREGLHLDTEPFAIEQKELEAVLDSGIFAVSSNAAKLLRYVCERHFHNTADGITEHDVAVHALGRRPDFDPHRDSIVRVEAHRVRKRLQEYYETEGASRPVKIVLSRGQYAPRFMHAETAAEPDAAVAARLDESLEPPAVHTAASTWGLRLLAWAIVAAALAAGLLWLLSSRHKLAPSGQRELTAAAGGDTVRILAGRDSGDYVDRAGTRWSGDGFFTGVLPRQSVIIRSPWLTTRPFMSTPVSGRTSATTSRCGQAFTRCG